MYCTFYKIIFLVYILHGIELTYGIYTSKEAKDTEPKEGDPLLYFVIRILYMLGVTIFWPYVILNGLFAKIRKEREKK